MTDAYVPQVSCPLCLVAHPAMEMVPVTIDQTLEKQPRTLLICQRCIGEVDYSAQTWRAAREEFKKAQAEAPAAEISESPKPTKKAKADQTVGDR